MSKFYRVSTGLLSVYIFGPSTTTTQLYTVRAAELVLLAPLAGLPSDPRA